MSEEERKGIPLDEWRAALLKKKPKPEESPKAKVVVKKPAKEG